MNGDENNTVNVTTFGEYVSFGRISKGLSKSEVARRVGITPQYMRDIEDGRMIPHEEKIEMLVGVLELEEVTAYKLADKIPVRILEQAKKEYYGE